MNTYRFAKIPSHSSVVAGVTTLVSAWFLVAAGTIVADPHAASLRADPPREELDLRMSAPVTSSPDVREKIVVTASRSSAL